MLVYQSVIISKLLFNWLFVTTQVIQNTGRRKHEEPINMEIAQGFPETIVSIARRSCSTESGLSRFVGGHQIYYSNIFQPCYRSIFNNLHIYSSEPWKTQPCIQHEPCQRQLWGKAWTKTRPTGRTWHQGLDRWWEGSTGRTHLPDSKQKGRACSGTLQQRYCLKLGVVCIPGLEGRGMMVIMLLNKTTLFSIFSFTQASLYLFLFVTCKWC